MSIVRTDLGTDLYPAEINRIGRIGVCSLCGGDVAAPKGVVECQACGAVPAPVVVQMVRVEKAEVPPA